MWQTQGSGSVASNSQHVWVDTQIGVRMDLSMVRILLNDACLIGVNENPQQIKMKHNKMWNEKLTDLLSLQSDE